MVLNKKNSNFRIHHKFHHFSHQPNKEEIRIQGKTTTTKNTKTHIFLSKCNTRTNQTSKIKIKSKKKGRRKMWFHKACDFDLLLRLFRVYDK
ncbi:unnamed protein product [Brassica oleracea var. botrytis]